MKLNHILLVLTVCVLGALSSVFAPATVATAQGLPPQLLSETQSFQVGDAGNPAPIYTTGQFIGGAYKFDREGGTRTLVGVQVKLRHFASWHNCYEITSVHVGTWEAYCNWDRATYGDPTPADMNGPGHNWMSLEFFLSKGVPMTWVSMVSHTTHANCLSMGYISTPHDGNVDCAGTSGTEVWHDRDDGWIAGPIVTDAQLLSDYSVYNNPVYPCNLKFAANYRYPPVPCRLFGYPVGIGGWTGADFSPIIYAKLVYYYQ